MENREDKMIIRDLMTLFVGVLCFTARGVATSHILRLRAAENSILGRLSCIAAGNNIEIRCKSIVATFIIGDYKTRSSGYIPYPKSPYEG